MTTTSSATTLTRIATVIIVGRVDRLIEAADVLGGAVQTGALRIVIVSTESGQAPPIESRPDVVSIGGLRPEHVNNAIAAVRLSSLPSVVWWRGGLPDGLEGVASLADRVVLDAEDPWPLWTRAPALFDYTAFTDLRWARLTRWRAAMAHFFDLPDIRESSRSFSRLTLRGSDPAQCALFAGWLDSSLAWDGAITREVLPGDSAIESVTLAGERGELSLRLRPNGTCLDTHARLAGDVLAARVVSVGDQHLRSLMSEELRVRSRDLAFERALDSAVRSHAHHP